MEGSINIASADCIIVLDAKVYHPEAIIVERYGRVVGTVSATYDFSKLPTEYHMSVLGMIQQSRRLLWCIGTPEQEAAVEQQVLEERARQENTWDHRLWRWLKREVREKDGSRTTEPRAG